jgi:mannose-1-phosphate guanylyltransferase
MRAMILAAGLGTRLRPLTSVRPKALVPIRGIGVLDFWIWRLHKAGFEAVVINACHLNERLLAAVRNRCWPIPVHVRVEKVLLGTGGGISNVLDFFQGQPFLVVNGDIICDAPLQDLVKQYHESQNPASLLMHDYPAFNNVAVDSRGRIEGFGQEAGRLLREGNGTQCLAFTGIHMIHPEVFDGFTRGQPPDILTIYRSMIHAGRPPLALRLPAVYWREVGSIESYRMLHRELCNLEEGAIPPLQTGKALWIDPAARISSDSHLRGWVSIGKRCCIMEGVEIENSILWDDVEVRPGSRLCNCIVTDGGMIAGKHDNEIIIGPLG